MRFVFLCITVVHIIFVSSCTFSQNKSITIETVEGVKLTTVPIVCGAPENNTFKVTNVMGSAFFVNDEGYFLTAGHVFDDWNKIDKSKGDCFPAVYIPKKGWHDLTNIQWFRFGKCFKSKDVDIAVCKSNVNPFTIEDIRGQIKIATSETYSIIADGTPVAFTGFPLESARPITSIGNIASYIKSDNLIIIDKNAWPGASGSPVYLSNGKVIGILIKRGINEGSGLAYAITAESAFKFLSKHNITFHQEK